MVAPRFFRTNWSLALLLLFSALLAGACGGNDSPGSTSPAASGGSETIELDEALSQVVGLYDNMLNVLIGVTDEASARTAMDELTRLTRQVEALERSMGDYSQAEVTGSVLWERFLDARQEIGVQFDRISADSAAMDLVTEAFENLE